MQRYLLIAMGYRFYVAFKLSCGNWEKIQSTYPNNIGKIEQWFRGMTTGSESIDFDNMTENKNMQFTQLFFSHDLFLLQSLKLTQDKHRDWKRIVSGHGGTWKLQYHCLLFQGV